MADRIGGFFISFEGGDGTGKSTQIARLADKLRADGFDVLTTREPGGTEGAEALRRIILSGEARDAGGAELEALLFAAARADHLDAVIRPALAAGRVVVTDRFHDSTRIYQGLQGVDVRFIERLERVTLAGTIPNLTIVLDLPAEAARSRVAARTANDRADRFERDDLATHEARRQGFLTLAIAHAERCVLVDGGGSTNAVAKEIAFIVEERFAVRALERNRAGTASNQAIS